MKKQGGEEFWGKGSLRDQCLRFGKWFTRGERNRRGEAGGYRQQGRAVIIRVDYTGPYAERAGFGCLPEERERLAQGLEEKMDFSRITLNNQEAGEEETQQKKRKILSRSSPAHVSQHKAVRASRNFSSQRR